METPTNQKVKAELPPRTRVAFAVAGLISGTILFVLSYVGMREKTGLGSFNQPVLSWMLSHRTAELTTIAKVVTSIASPIYFAAITAIIIIIWSLKKREVWRPLVLALAVGLSAVVSFTLKLLTADARPPVTNMVPAFELDYSFPSGHTISIVVLLLVIGYLFYSRRFSIARLSGWAIATITLGGAIAASRLYLGYHWLTDVVASAGLGFIILSIFIIVDVVYTNMHEKD
jgi:undecaprenyl-diphosphatase